MSEIAQIGKCQKLTNETPDGIDSPEVEEDDLGDPSVEVHHHSVVTSAVEAAGGRRLVTVTSTVASSTPVVVRHHGVV